MIANAIASKNYIHWQEALETSAAQVHSPA